MQVQKVGDYSQPIPGAVETLAWLRAQGVKIGILNDQSGVYADYGGKWSVEAARMAIEDFGGEVLGQGEGAHGLSVALQLRGAPDLHLDAA